MTFLKRLRMLKAVLTQQWRSFQCPCGNESWMVGKAQPLLDGQLCEDCEMRQHEQWVKEFIARCDRDTKGVA